MVDERPIKDLTADELYQLKGIREVVGKGYIRDYSIKMVHVCPKCNQAKGWNHFTICLNCGYELSSPEDYSKLETRERWIRL